MGPAPTIIDVEIVNEEVFSVELTETVIDVELLAAGPQGPAGKGVVPGGTTGQVLRKASGIDYDTSWSTLGKADVGLGNVDNTSDAAKPVSTAQAAAIALKTDKTYVDSQDAGVASTAATALAAHTNRTDNPHATTKAQVGLGNVDNTSDANKPVSTAQATAIALKADKTYVDTQDSANAAATAAKYTKPGTGIPKTDLESAVQTSLGKADSALQSVPDATTTSKGQIQLTNDLGGTAAAPTVKNVAKIYSVKDYGAVGDGSTDDAPGIKAAITAMGSSIGVLHFPQSAASYIANSNIPLPSNIFVIFYKGTAITTSMLGSNHRGIFTLSNVSNVTIDGANFVVNVNASGSSTAITSYGHDRLTVQNCSFTGTTDIFCGFINLDGEKAVASFSNTLIQGNKFFNANANQTCVHLYPRFGFIIERTKIIGNTFEGTSGTGISLDAYDILRSTVITNNTFRDLRFGGTTTTPGVAVFSRLGTSNFIFNTVVADNSYVNTLTTALHQQGFVYIYGAQGTVISGNTAIGSWTPSQNTAGPAIAPGRAGAPEIGLLVVNNFFQGFDSAVDADSQIGSIYSNNYIYACGDSIPIGYNIQKYVKVVGNVFHNSSHRTLGAGITLGGATTLMGCEVKDNIFADDLPTPRMTTGIYLASHIDQSSTVFTNNRFVVANGSMTQITKNFGDEIAPSIYHGNQFKDNTGVVNTPVSIEMGGTGSTIKNFVDLSNAQTIAGTKTFAVAPVVPGGSFPESAVSNLVSDLAATEKVANKGTASGYAPLDASSKVPSANLPTAPVTSVNTKSGAVVLNPDDLSDTSSTNKFTSAAEKTKLAGIQAGATANSTDAQLRDRGTHTGTQVAATISDFSAAVTAQVGTQKGQPNGIASLDTNGLVPAAQLPSYVDDVLEYASTSTFPGTGETGKIYVAKDTGKIYRFTGSIYVEISPSPGSTDAVPEGSSNLYYTNARASAAAPVQSVAGRTGAVTLVEADIANLTSDLASKEPAVTAGTTSQYYRGDKTFQTLNVASLADSSTVALLAGAQTFTGQKTFPSPIFTAGATFSAGDATFDNGKGIRIKDSGGTARYVFFQDAANNYQVLNNAASGSTYLGNANASNTGGVVYMQVAGANKTRLDSTGLRVGDGSAPTSTLQSAGSFSAAITPVTTSTPITSAHGTIRSNSSSALTHTLPDATGCVGRFHTIKNVGTGAVTVATTASQTIDGAASYTLATQYKYVTVQSNGTNWDVVGNN